MKSTVVAALMLVPVLGLAGCGGDNSEGTPDPIPSTTAPTSASSDPGIVTPASVPPIPAFKGKPAGIILDTDITECTTDPGTVTASGTVSNKAPGPRDIAIAISWVVPNGSDVLARGVIKLPQVVPNKTTSWKVTATLAGTDPVQCVGTALRGTFLHPTGTK